MTLWEDQKLKPAYGLIDLLIAEESGQVSPEVAGPSFALAKRAVVVGDTLQIEPVWGISETIDRSNAQIEKLDPDELCATGHLASSGSVMRMAQSVTSFSSDLAPGLSPGLYLVEHRRCLEEIISYCNDLCYEGVLIPKTNGTPKTGLPPMYGLHVQGLAESKGGSRANTREATFIADWLSANKAMLCNAYGKELFEVVGIVTPFKANTVYLKRNMI